MEIVQKKWYWIFTFPFAHNNFTTLRDTLYYPKKKYPSKRMIAHETIHSHQQKKIGMFKYLCLYLFAFPFFYNKSRFSWELEAYVHGTKLSKAHTFIILRSYKYGWLRNKESV